MQQHETGHEAGRDAHYTGDTEHPDEEHGQTKGFGDVREMKPHQSVGFWHHRMNKVRKHVVQLWCRTGTCFKHSHVLQSLFTCLTRWRLIDTTIQSSS